LSGVIESIHDGETEKVLQRIFSHHLPIDIQQVTYRKLRMLNNARFTFDLRIPPPNHLYRTGSNS